MAKIVIISDIHNNEINLKKVLDYCEREKIETIICCGDMASKEVLDFMNDTYSGIILYTYGNADYDDLRDLEEAKKYRNTYIFKDFGEANIEKKAVAFTHYPQKAKSLARTKKYNFVFHGHTHKPWEEIIDNCKILNPGNVAGDIYPPTFAIWETDTDKFELIRIHNLN
ncbi:MAG: YfcE family phosphodiesterase [Candidatus Moraniibacteriota bacterium]